MCSFEAASADLRDRESARCISAQGRPRDPALKGPMGFLGTWVKESRMHGLGF